MNANRHKIVSKSNNNVRPCPNVCKHLLKTPDKSAKQQTHMPTIRCHEEVMSEMVTSHSKPEYFTSELDVPCCNKESKINKKSKSKENNKTRSKYTNTKPITYCESTNDKINSLTDDVDVFQKSKSTPIVHMPNLEDSVDFIPVKLSNKINGLKKIHQKHEPRSLSSEKIYRNRGPTWDQLLKGESKIYNNNVRNKTDNLKEENHFSHNKANIEVGIQANIHPAYNISNCPNSDEVVNGIRRVSDPIKTLDILIEKLREKILKQPQNDNLSKIILDMENALRKICPEDQPKAESEICTSSVKSSTVTASKSPQSDTKQSTVAEWDIPLLKKNLEESCLFLQSLCIKQRETCTNYIREKEQLSIQLAESRRLVAIAQAKEKEYEKVIGELRLKLQETNTLKEQQYKSLQVLNNQVAKLKTKNEALESSNARLKEFSSEKEKLQSKLYLKDLEIEKLKVLLEVKQSVTSDLKNKQKFNEGIIEDELRLGISHDDKATLLSLTSESSLSFSKPRIICSSQASSSPRRSPSPYDSWQHISSIPQDLTEINELRNSMVRVFNIMKTDSEWCDSLDLELEDPLVPSCYSEEDDEIKPKEINLGYGSMELLRS